LPTLKHYNLRLSLADDEQCSPSPWHTKQVVSRPRPCEMEPAEKVRHMGQAAAWPGAGAYEVRRPTGRRAGRRCGPVHGAIISRRARAPVLDHCLRVPLPFDRDLAPPCGFCDRRARHVTKARPDLAFVVCVLPMPMRRLVFLRTWQLPAGTGYVFL
jgi:hypothetical protein